MPTLRTTTEGTVRQGDQADELRDAIASRPSLLLIFPIYWPTHAAALMRCQQPLHVSPRELDATVLVSERVDATLNVWPDRPARGKVRLSLCANLRLGAPRLALCMPVGWPRVVAVGGRA